MSDPLVPISWVTDADGGLASLLGLADEVSGVADAADGFGKAAKTVLEAANTVGQLGAVVAGLGDLGLATLIRPILEDLRQRVRDLRKTGVYMLPIGFRPPNLRGPIRSAEGATFDGVTGGLQGLKHVLATALQNERDPMRPAFSDSAFVVGTLAVGYGPDASTIARIRALYEKVFVSRTLQKSVARINKFFTSDATAFGLDRAFRDAFFANQQAESPAPLWQTPWIFQNLSEMVPQEFFNAFLTIESLLAGLEALLSKINVLKQLIDVIQEALNDIAAALQVIEDLLTFLDLILLKFPIAIGYFGPQYGGVRGIVDNLDRWFDPTTNPILRSVTPNAMMVGMLFLSGGPDLRGVEAEAAIISRIIQFGIS